MFLKRLNIVLGERKKHPWGLAIGLKGTLINNMFKGTVPGPDQLKKISRAENVRIDWLLDMDEGSPYKTRANLGDDASALRIQALSANDYEPILLLDDKGHAGVVATKKETIKYDDDTTAKYTAIEILPNIGTESVTALENVNTHYSLVLRSDVFSKIMKGWVSTYELTCENGILINKERVKRTEQIGELVTEYSLDNSTTDDLIRRTGQLSMSQLPDDPLNELYVLLDVFRYLDEKRLQELMNRARDLAAEQLATEYTLNENNAPQ